MSQATLNQAIRDKIDDLSARHKINPHILEELASFVLENYSKEPKTGSPEPLSINELKEAIYNHFRVDSTSRLKRSNSFKMATDGMGELDYRYKETWEKLYRKLIGILPHEKQEEGYGCINGINIFKYFQPWRVFGLDPKTATETDIKQAYYRLSKTYHPDASTGDAQIFDRINTMYESLIAEG